MPPAFRDYPKTVVPCVLKRSVMKSKVLFVLSLVLLSFLAFSIFTGYTDKDKAQQQRQSQFLKNGLPQSVTSVTLKKNYDFAGEALPMKSFDVRERLERELLVNSYWHSSTLFHLKNSARYFPVVEPILKANGVPDDFKYLAVAESGFQHVVSPAGATGAWQFLKGTAESYNLEVNSEVDERYHIEKSTQAACEFLLQLKARFGTWTFAAAAYNFGASNLKEAVADQRAKTYYDLNLNAETARYVFRLVALKEILSHPEEFGFQLEDKHLYEPLDNYKEIEVSEAVENWGDFAAKYDMSYRLLKIYNPWLRSAKLTNKKGKTYQIKVVK